MKTSIVIPVKDDDYIYTCLRKLLPQVKNKSREVVVVDDKLSKEGFSIKLKDFCKKNKVGYSKAKRPGAAYNRNKGMEMAKGENILFIDSDCFPSRKWVSEMENSLRDSQIVEGEIIYNSKTASLLDRVVENRGTPFRFLTANLGIKREVAEKCSFDDRFIVFREDTDFGLCALEKGFKHSFCYLIENVSVNHCGEKFE